MEMTPQGVGLCGSHRTGKTTLAQALSTKLNIPFAKTDTSGVFKKHGLDPAVCMPFSQRLHIQHLILDDAIKIWGAYKSAFITDRTPLDMLAYTLCDITGSTEADFTMLEEYARLCFEAVNRFFGLVVVIQPAIAMRYEEGKAALNRAYLEHLNAVIMGLCLDERQKANFKILPKAITDFDERINTLCQWLQS